MKSYFRIGIALAFIGLSIAVSLLLRYPAAELMIVLLFAFALGLLSFLVVGRISGSAKFFNMDFKTISSGFAVFLTVIVCYFQLGNRLFKFNEYQKEIIEISDPSNVAIWEKPVGEFKWFNAPFAFAITSHFKTKLKWFDKPDFHLSVLMIDSKDSSQHQKDFGVKLQRLRIFLDSLTAHKIDCEKRFEIRVYTANNIPSTSFFITKKTIDNRPYSIMYMSKTSRPDECLVSESETFERILNSEFQNYWENDDTRLLSIPLLLNKNLKSSDPTSVFYQ